jgi:uncharacterized protein (DUF427 family)
MDQSVLERSWMKSPCDWNGLASCYHVEAGGQRSANPPHTE